VMVHAELRDSQVGVSTSSPSVRKYWDHHIDRSTITEIERSVKTVLCERILSILQSANIYIGMPLSRFVGVSEVSGVDTDNR
jgi:hypothetical protein